MQPNQPSCPNDESTRALVTRVRIRHNIVWAVTSVQPNEGVEIPTTPLDVSKQLACRFQKNGCIDGDYHFAGVQRAKIFASLAQDFMLQLCVKSKEALELFGATSDRSWRNPFAC